MSKCQCRVCKTGRWVEFRYGTAATEDWFNEGFHLECKSHFDGKLWDKLVYWLHFQKWALAFKHLNRRKKHA